MGTLLFHSTRRRRAAIAPVAVLLTAFYLLAAGRAFVPDMCATQRLMQEAYAAPAECSIGALKACCAKPGESAPENGGAPVAPPVCAFCDLAKALTLPVVPVVYPGPVQAVHAEPIPAKSLLFSAGFDCPTASRAPPRLS